MCMGTGGAQKTTLDVGPLRSTLTRDELALGLARDSFPFAISIGALTVQNPTLHMVGALLLTQPHPQEAPT